VTTQVPVPEQPPPDQPANAEPGAAVGVNVTWVPWAKTAEHVGWQAIPAGALLTDPAPLPANPTAKVWLTDVCGIGPKVASTRLERSIVSVQSAVPEHPSPLQPANAQPSAGVA
jgi:hypothetical protein